jgi:maleamate amidohydrolase
VNDTTERRRGDTSVLSPRSEYRRLGAGERPALLIVDMQNAFIDDSGSLAQNALARTVVLLDAFRRRGRPVYFGALRAPSMADMNLRWRELGDVERLVIGEPAADIHVDLTPLTNERVFDKAHASCFYGTDLDSALEADRIDTLVVAGNATSGCIRATVVDAAARSLHVIVAEDAVFDWRVLSGEVALNDIAERYGDVVPVDEVLSALTLR